jgi:hypothetical protein
LRQNGHHTSFAEPVLLSWINHEADNKPQYAIIDGRHRICALRESIRQTMHKSPQDLKKAILNDSRASLRAKIVVHSGTDNPLDLLKARLHFNWHSLDWKRKGLGGVPLLAIDLIENNLVDDEWTACRMVPESFRRLLPLVPPRQ